MQNLPVVIVTGASRGIGLAVCQRLIAKNARVVAVSRSPLNQDLVDASPSGSLIHVQLDVASDGSSNAIVDAALSKFGRIDGVVFNAGILEVSKVAQTKVADFRRLMDVTLTSVYELTQLCIPHLRESHGKLVFVSSGAAVNAYPGWSGYCISKAALNMLAACVAKEEPSIVSVAVRPGVVDTDMQIQIREPQNADAMTVEGHSKFIKLHMDGNLVPPENPGNVIAGLALTAAKDLSGAFISWDDAKLASYSV